jgi:probable HAF family extracellular repeat protein
MNRQTRGVTCRRRNAQCCLIAVLTVVASAGTARAQYIPLDLGLGAAYDINSSGTIVGFTTRSGNQRAFRYENGILTELGTLGSDAFSIAYSINTSGIISGTSYDTAAGFPRGFIVRGGVMSDIGTLGYATFANAINDADTITGESVVNTIGFPSHAFRYSGGVMTDLGTLGGRHSGAAGINTAGTIVGWSEINLSGGATDAFSYIDGAFTDLGTLGGQTSYAQAINDSGIIVGRSNVPGDAQYHAFRHENGVMTDLGTLGGAFSLANAVNSAGMIVGSAETPGGSTHAFYHNGQVMSDLAPYLALIGLTGRSEALGINDRGDIVGVGYDALDKQHAFLLSVPEPSAWALCGVAGICFVVASALRSGK